MQFMWVNDSISAPSMHEIGEQISLHWLYAGSRQGRICSRPIIRAFVTEGPHNVDVLKIIRYSKFKSTCHSASISTPSLHSFRPGMRIYREI